MPPGEEEPGKTELTLSSLAPSLRSASVQGEPAWTAPVPAGSESGKEGPALGEREREREEVGLSTRNKEERRENRRGKMERRAGQRDGRRDGGGWRWSRRRWRWKREEGRMRGGEREQSGGIPPGGGAPKGREPPLRFGFEEQIKEQQPKRCVAVAMAMGSEARRERAPIVASPAPTEASLCHPPHPRRHPGAAVTESQAPRARARARRRAQRSREGPEPLGYRLLSSSFSLSPLLLMQNAPPRCAFGGGSPFTRRTCAAAAFLTLQLHLGWRLKTHVCPTFIGDIRRWTCVLLLPHKGRGINGAVSMVTRHLPNMGIMVSSLSAHASTSAGLA